MNRVRAVFLEPFWGFLFALLPWVLLIPLLLDDSGGMLLELKSLELEIDLNNFMNYALSASFLSLIGLIFIKLFNQLNVLVKENYLIGLVVSILGSVMLNINGFTAPCLAVLFYTLGLYWLCNSPKEGKLNKYVFNAGFFFFLSVLAKSEFLLIVPLGLVLLLFLRTFRFRMIAVFFSAFLALILLLEQLNFLLKDEFIEFKHLVSFHDQNLTRISEILAFNFIGLFVFQLVLSIFSFSNLFISLNNKLKAIIRILFYGFVILAALFLLEKLLIKGFSSLVYLMPLISLLITVNVMFTKNKWLFRINLFGLTFSMLVFFFNFF